MVQKLLDAGANSRLLNAQGAEALACAAGSGHIEVVDALLKVRKSGTCTLWAELSHLGQNMGRTALGYLWHHVHEKSSRILASAKTYAWWQMTQPSAAGYRTGMWT